jgi:hypothetical protein
MNRERRRAGRAIRKSRRDFKRIDWTGIIASMNAATASMVDAMNQFVASVSAAAEEFARLYHEAMAEGARSYRMTYRALPEKPSPWAAPIRGCDV